jgi:hypothetical protein
VTLKTELHLNTLNVIHDDEMTNDIDVGVIRLMISNGLDCSGLACPLKLGEKNEIPILSHIYLRQKQSEKMNRILQMSNRKASDSPEQKSTPVI